MPRLVLHPFDEGRSFTVHAPPLHPSTGWTVRGRCHRYAVQWAAAAARCRFGLEETGSTDGTVSGRRAGDAPAVRPALRRAGDGRDVPCGFCPPTERSRVNRAAQSLRIGTRRMQGPPAPASLGEVPMSQSRPLDGKLVGDAGEDLLRCAVGGAAAGAHRATRPVAQPSSARRTVSRRIVSRRGGPAQTLHPPVQLAAVLPLNGPIADLQRPVPVRDLRDLGQPLRRRRIELPRRHPAQSRPRLGPTLSASGTPT